jgi:AcrR family transcriptional regulator
VPVAPAIPISAGTRRKGELTAERILDAAEALFAERGYDGTTLRDVAARVGLRIPSLYNHFASKESLYAAVLERGIGPVLEVLSEFVAAGDARARDSGRVIERVIALLARRPNLPRLVQHETLSGGQRLTPMLRGWIGPAFARAQEMVEATEGAQRWEREHLPLLVLAVFHALLGYFAIAPFYRDLNGLELLSESMLEGQTRLLREIVAALFRPDAPPPTR